MSVKEMHRLCIMLQKNHQVGFQRLTVVQRVAERKRSAAPAAMISDNGGHYRAPLHQYAEKVI
jgi:hypothetical protein